MTDDFPRYDMFEAHDHREQMEEAKRRNAIAAEQEAAERAKRMESLRRFREAGHARELAGQFARAGVEPPFVDAAGVPTVSLPMLLSIGWEVQEVMGEKRLVKAV